MVKQIASQQEFQAAIAQQKLVVVDFFATWCGPCKAVAPAIEQMSAMYPSVSFIKVDVDQLNQVAAMCGITAMPTFQFYKGGQKIAQDVKGANPQAVEAVVKQFAFQSFTGQGKSLGGGNNAPQAGQVYKNPWADNAVRKQVEVPDDDEMITDDDVVSKLAEKKRAEKETLLANALKKKDADQQNKPKEAPKPAAPTDTAHKEQPAQPADTTTPAATTDAAPPATDAPALTQEQVHEAVRKIVNEDVLKEMLAMEFTEVRALKALINTGGKTSNLEAAVNWLYDHEKDEDIDKPIEFSVETPEQKQKRIEEQKEQYKYLLAEKKKMREAEEKKAELEREKKRRTMGQQTQEAQEKYKEEQRLREIEEKKKEKLREQQEKLRVKKMMEEDKLRRKLEKAKKENNAEEIAEIEKKLFGSVQTKPVVAAPTTTATQQSVPKAEEDCVLQIRLLNGTAIKANFKPSDTLQVVKSHAATLQNGMQNFSLMTTFPRKVYQGPELSKTLAQLGLTKAALVCTTGI